MPERRILRTRTAPEIAALATLTLLVGWALMAGASATALLLLGCAGTYLLSRAVSAVRAALVPTAAVVAVVAAALLGERAWSGEPLAGPLGYANANAALFVQGVAAAGALRLSGGPGRRRAATLGAVLLTTAAVATGSKAGAVLAVAVLLVALRAGRVRHPRRLLLACLLTPLLALVASLVIAAYPPGTQPLVDTVVAESLTTRRPQLWREALTLVAQHPLSGAGEGSFAARSPTAQLDRDARWAHHETLEVTAETGLPGGLLLVGLATACSLALLALPGPVAPRLVTAAGQAALWVHATVDYVLHFPAVPLVAAALLGAGVSAGGFGRGPREPGSRGSRRRCRRSRAAAGVGAQ